MGHKYLSSASHSRLHCRFNGDEGRCLQGWIFACVSLEYCRVSLGDCLHFPRACRPPFILHRCPRGVKDAYYCHKQFHAFILHAIVDNKYVSLKPVAGNGVLTLFVLCTRCAHWDELLPFPCITNSFLVWNAHVGWPGRFVAEAFLVFSVGVLR